MITFLIAIQLCIKVDVVGCNKTTVQQLNTIGRKLKEKYTEELSMYNGNAVHEVVWRMLH
jgi:hypothetical protein